ncbi:unnamed protein product [Adineta steineri]|uniref:Uncharacterized protein n=1 Tax=Adineta steineri TaxID=433720 RepID=A0A819K0K2_9BILA|nr:unnamed protein product [Adineta steineri]CAF3942528.1 unnamed protein product [Adineta steineri]
MQTSAIAIDTGSYYLRNGALDTVRYAEFGISSCNIGPNSSVHIGKQLVRFLSTYMPYLQTLRLWRPDDFPWSSIEQLKEFVYLDIYGRISNDKVEPYRLMVQKRFPNSRIYIQISRFSLWI